MNQYKRDQVKKWLALLPLPSNVRYCDVPISEFDRVELQQIIAIETAKHDDLDVDFKTFRLAHKGDTEALRRHWEAGAHSWPNGRSPALSKAEKL